VNSLLIISIILTSIGSLEWPLRTFFHFSIIDLVCGNIFPFYLTALVSMGLAAVYMLYRLFWMIRLPNEA
jgi:uncharacterized membrane protein YuzA (DUF378 family)